MKALSKDRRVRKTRQALVEAVMGLVSERRHANITVQHVLERANVGRSTFYAHFRNLDDLFEAMHGTVFASIREARERTAQSKIPAERLVGFSGAFFELVFQWRHVYRRVSKGGGVNVHAFLLDLIHAGAKPTRKAGPLEAVLPNYLAASMQAVVEWWLDQKEPMGPKDIDALFHQLVGPTLERHLR